MSTSLEDAKRELKKVWRDCAPSRDHLPKELYHYTSAEGLHGIMKHRTLWLSKISTFNDTSEILHGGATIKDVIRDAMRSEAIEGNSALNLQAVADKGENFVEVLRSHSYAFCFCSRHDRLCQWGVYGGTGAGYEIGFNRALLEAYLEEKFSEELIRVSDPTPMIYGKSQQKKAARCFVSKAITIAANPTYGLQGSDLTNFNDEFGFRLHLFLLAMKSPFFSQEEEWRILQVSRDQKAVNFRPAHGVVIPNLELSGIPPRVFASITLGPKLDPSHGVEPMRLYLDQNGLNHVKVRLSRIPLRPSP